MNFNEEFLPDKVAIFKNILLYQIYQTPLGDMIGCFFEDRLCLLDFCDKKSLQIQLQKLQKTYQANLVQESNLITQQLKQELDEYFKGNRKFFSIPLQKHGTDFQHAAWDALEQIPYGCTVSYKQQALVILKPKAVRAVAHANSKNCISILIPCHRVIAANGDLQGYAGGISRKEFLLKLEQKNAF